MNGVKKQSTRGAILVFITIICAALLWLGATFLDLAGTDLLIAVNQRDALQAYYLAETGIEAALAVLSKHDPYYVGSGEIAFAGGRVFVRVNALEQEGGDRWVEIISTGKAENVQEKIHVEFCSFPATPEGVEGAALGWYEENSGAIIPGGHVEVEKVVLLRPCGAVPLILHENMVGEGALFSAGPIYFETEPVSLVAEETLEICSEIIVFRGSIILNPPGGALCLTSPAGPVRAYFQQAIISSDDHLLLAPGVYDFPGEFSITRDSLPEETDSLRVLPLVPGTMLRRRGSP